MSLAMKTWLGFAALAAAMGLVLFATAGTLAYWQAWLYLAVFFAAAISITFYLYIHDPALLQRRLRAGPTAEKEISQKFIMLFASIGWIALLFVPALDHRFGWSDVPVRLLIAADLLVAFSFYLVFLVYKANTYTSATIQVTEGQTVVSTGPYALVRHPMYAGSLPSILGMPLALGSYWGLLVLPVFIGVLLSRLFDEERVLARELPGYREYCAKVRWRMIPGIF
jgi:protein-S-isoprenylcysteine O-methyltransferase Ste14